MWARRMAALVLVSFAAAFAAEDMVKTWNFQADKVDEPPAGFSFGKTGQGRKGKWVVREDSGKRVLAQIDTDDTDYRFPVAVADEPVVKDLRLEVSCKPVSGKTDQACGLVFRYQDENNYYVTRANALENNVRLYRVVAGKRIQLASWKGKVKGGVWHDLKVEARGDRFQVFFNGTRVMDARDGTFKTA